MVARCRRRMHESRARDAVCLERACAAPRTGIRVDQRTHVVDLHDRRRRVRGSFVVAGAFRTGAASIPRLPCRLARGLGFVLSSCTTSWTNLYLIFGVVVGLGNGFGYATPYRCIEAVSRQAWARRWPRRRRLRRGLGHLRPVGQSLADSGGRLAQPHSPRWGWCSS